MDVLEVKNLTKKFKSFTAVDSISFSLHEGEILGLLGVNGAGKTTTLQMLLGVLTPTSGNVSYFGKSLFTHREEILEYVNFSSTYTNLPWNLTVKENLKYISYMYNIPNRKKRLEKIINDFKLDEFLNDQMHTLSAGQLTRVNLAKSFINFPKVLLLDEPTASLDPDIAHYIHQFLLEERKNFQVSIIITSHNMSEVEKLCDRVIFIDHGKIIADNTPDTLAKSIQKARVELYISHDLDKLKKYCTDKNLQFSQEGNYIKIDVSEKEIPLFLKDLSDQNIAYQEITIEKPTLEDYFIQIAHKNSHEIT